MGQFEALINKLGGEERTKLFLSGQLVVVSPDQVSKPSILKIDRTNPFDPAKFIGEGWSIWRGPKDGKGLEGDEEQDSRSLAITELDPTKLFAQTGLNEDETTVTGEEKRARLMLKAIQADAKIARVLYEEEGQTTLKWLHKTLNLTWIEFLGTTLRSPGGRRNALYLYRDGDGSWSWGCYWLDYNRHASYPAVGFAQ
jgi:hypothetical protein